MNLRVIYQNILFKILPFVFVKYKTLPKIYTIQPLYTPNLQIAKVGIFDNQNIAKRLFC